VVRSLPADGVFLYGPRTHPALWRRNQDFNNLDFEEWVDLLPARIEAARSDNIFILFNSLDPLLARKYEVTWLSQLKTSKQITIIIDDSHGLGITGRNGTGIWGEMSLPESFRLVVVSSLGKALGIPGGVILSDAATVQNFKKSAFFGGGSPVIPAYLYAFLQSSEIYQEAREKLSRNISYFHSLLKTPTLFQTFRGYPVLYTAQHKLYKYLLSHHILISSFSYPTPADDPVTRIILSSLHTPADLEKLAALVNKFAAGNLL
jgi:8-amino-7-oxononanoate synthase